MNPIQRENLVKFLRIVSYAVTALLGWLGGTAA